MRQQAEGIEASRLAAVEQSDGSLHVTLVIPPRGKAAFFSLFAELGTPLLLSVREEPASSAPAADKPPTQKIVAVGEDMSGMMGAAETKQLTLLFNHPPFQAWVEELHPNETGVDAVAHARQWVEHEAQVGPARYADTATRQRVGEIVERYARWFETKYGSGEKPVPS